MSCYVAVCRRWVTSSWRHVVQLRKYGKRQDLVMSHFMHVHKYEFLPKKGHILNHTFKFKDYCPEVFRHLRERFGISDSDYLESFRCACTGNGHYHCSRRLRPRLCLHSHMRAMVSWYAPAVASTTSLSSFPTPSLASSFSTPTTAA